MDAMLACIDPYFRTISKIDTYRVVRVQGVAHLIRASQLLKRLPYQSNDIDYCVHYDPLYVPEHVQLDVIGHFPE